MNVLLRLRASSMSSRHRREVAGSRSVPGEFGFAVRKWGVFNEMLFWNEPNEPEEPREMAAWIGVPRGSEAG